MASAANIESASNQAAKIWIGIAVGAAVGIGVALSRRKKTRWPASGGQFRRFRRSTRGIVERVRNIYQESRKVVEDASQLWSHGRKLVGH